MSSGVLVGWGLAAVLLCLVAVAAGIAVVARMGVARALITAAARATVQLAAVSALIVAVVRSAWLTAVFVLVMFAAASWTSARRIVANRSGLFAALPIAAGTLPVLALVLGSGAVPRSAIAVVPTAGIIIGGAMTATSLAGRRGLDELATRHGEYEAALSLGLTDRDAALEICRPATTLALVPALDQTRTVGLVTLPGAFVGVLLGSGNAIQAGAAQLLVLIGLLAAETTAVLTTTELVARGHIAR
jgi:UDP-glucose/iron transport system permease protein